MENLTKSAISATIHCLTGCAIGEIAGMVVGTALNLHNLVVTLLSIVLAFVFGYSLTVRSVVRHGMTVKQGLKVAIAADTLSISSMEVVDNVFVWLVPGAVNAALGDILFWWSLVVSLILAFIITVPVNRLLIAHGKGHAAMPGHHH